MDVRLSGGEGSVDAAVEYVFDTVLYYSADERRESDDDDDGMGRVGFCSGVMGLGLGVGLRGGLVLSFSSYGAREGARVVWLVLKTLVLSVVGYIIDVDCLRGLSLLL